MAGFGFSTCVCLMVLLQCWNVETGKPEQMGKEFIVGFMNMEFCNTDVELIITTDSVANVTVVVTIPLFNASWIETVTVNSTDAEIVRIGCLLRGSGISKENKGVKVMADGDVTVFGVNKEGRLMDQYLALPLEVLGEDYMVMNGVGMPELMVIGTRDNTTVNLTFPPELDVSYQGTQYGSDNPLVVHLDKYETFHVGIDNPNITLTGTRIQSDQPVAVLSGNRETSIQGTGPNTTNHMVEMMLPMDLWGKRYAIAHTPFSTEGDILWVLATEDNTTTRFSDVEIYHIAKAGTALELDIPDDVYKEFVSDKAVITGIFSKSSTSTNPERGNPSMAQLITEHRWRSNYTWSTTQITVGNQTFDFNNVVVVIIDEQQKDGLLLDGYANISWDGEEPFMDSTLIHLWKLVTPGTHQMTHIHPGVRFFLLLSGSKEGVSYSSPAGFGMGSYKCQIAGDPHLITFAYQSISLAIPCAFTVTILRVLNDYYRPGIPFYKEIEMVVVAGNSQRPVNGRYYISDVFVTVTFRNGSALPISNEYWIDEKYIDHGHTWMIKGNETLQDRVLFSLDIATKMVTLEVKDTTLRVQFRPVNRHQGNHQHHTPGVFVKVGYDLIYDDSIRFPVTMCSTVDDTTSIAEYTIKENINRRYIGIVTVLKYISYNIATGDQDVLCPTLVGKLIMCSRNNRETNVFEHCFALLMRPFISKCFENTFNDTHITSACSVCLDFHCTDDVNSCNVLQNYTYVCPGIDAIAPIANCTPQA